MTEKFLVCAIMLFILTFGFCAIIGALLKWVNDKPEWLQVTVYIIITVLCLFGSASIFGTIFMVVFFIQSLFGF
jgi:hypothetical protein